MGGVGGSGPEEDSTEDSGPTVCHGSPRGKDGFTKCGAQGGHAAHVISRKSEPPGWFVKGFCGFMALVVLLLLWALLF